MQQAAVYDPPPTSLSLSLSPWNIWAAQGAERRVPLLAAAHRACRNTCTFMRGGDLSSGGFCQRPVQVWRLQGGEVGGVSAAGERRGLESSSLSAVGCSPPPLPPAPPSVRRGPSSPPPPCV